MNCPKCGREGLKITRVSMDDLRAARVFWRCQSCHIWYDERGVYGEMPKALPELDCGRYENDGGMPSL